MRIKKEKVLREKLKRDFNKNTEAFFMYLLSIPEKLKREDGYFCKSLPEIKREIGLGKGAIYNSRKKLQEIGLLDIKYGIVRYKTNVSKTTHYKINYENMYEYINKKDVIIKEEKVFSPLYDTYSTKNKNIGGTI